MKKYHLVFAMTLFLTGCGSFPVEQEYRNGVKHFIVPAQISEQLRTASSCCRSYSEIQYAELYPNQNLEIKIDPESPAYDFETGKSFFLAYKLPVTNLPYKMTIKSFFSGHAFYPSVLLLDGEYKVTRSVSKSEFKYTEPGLVERGRIEGSILFTPSKNNETYLIIHTTDELMNEVVFSSESGYGYATSTGPAFAPGGKYASHFGPVGMLKVITAVDCKRSN